MTTATDYDITSRPQLARLRELYCRACGYGIVVQQDPPECPMCHDTTWAARATAAHWS